MPFAHGKNTTVLLDAANLSPFLNSADVSFDVESADTTAFQSSWKTAIAGVLAAKADLGGMYDPTELTMRNLVGSDASLTGGLLTIAPAPTIGERAHLLAILASSYAESSPVGGIVGLKWSVLASGTAGIGQLLHPLAEDTNTTTGAGKDDGGQTTTGWTAHLHVTAVDAGSWVVKLQDSSDGSAWADVSGGAFTAKTGPGAQRLISAAGATLRRHVRYVATRTGGSAGDGITFALAYSRNS